MEQQEIEQFREQLKALTESMQGIVNGTDKAAVTMGDELGKKFPNAAKPAMAALSGLGNAVTDVTAAVYRGERGMSVMANGIDKLVDGLQTAVALFTMFTPMGKALSLGSKLLINGVALAAKGVSSINKLNAEQTDKLYKTYKNLSDVGVVGAGGLEQLVANLQQAGFSVAEIDQFANVIKRNSQDLVAFGASAQSGAESLAKISGGIIKSNLGQSLMMLGYDAESLAQSTASYMVLQTQVGKMQLKTAQELQQGAGQYAQELDKLTRLTGLSREEAEKRQKSLIGDERYAGFMATEARQKGYNTENLASFFATITDEAARKGAQHLLASGGTATSEESKRVQQTDPRAYERMMRVAQGGSFIQEAQGFQGAARQYMQGYGGQLARFGGTGPGISVSGGLMDAEKMAAQQEAARKAGFSNLEDYIKAEQEKTKADQGTLKTSVEINRGQMNMAQQLDSTVKGLNAFQTATSSLTSAFDKLTTKILPGTPAGGKAAVGGAPGIAGLRDLIAQGESGGDYNVMVGGDKADLTNMTLSQVIALQKQRATTGKGSAAGKYQIINKTLEGLISEGNIDKNARFDEAMQDQLADMLIKKRGLTDYQTGKISKEQFVKNLSQEWAAIPSSAANKSNYEGVGNNKATMSWDQMMQGVQNTVPTTPGPSGAFGWEGRISGPMSGYNPNLLMHGDEDISVRPARANSDTQASDNSGISDLLTDIRELVSVSKQQLATSQKILRVQQ